MQYNDDGTVYKERDTRDLKKLQPPEDNFDFDWTVYAADGSVLRTRYEKTYDENGKVIKLSKYYKEGKLEDKIEFAYDSYGNMIARGRDLHDKTHTLQLQYKDGTAEEYQLYSYGTIFDYMP